MRQGPGQVFTVIKVMPLKRKLHETVERAKEIHRRAKDEDRDLTAEEQKKYNKLMSDAEQQKIAVREAELQQEEELNAPLSDEDWGAPCHRSAQSNTRARTVTDSQGREVPLLTHEQRMSDHVGGRLPDGMEANAATTGRIFRGLVAGWEGLEQERRALQGAEDPQGGYLLPEPLSTRLIDLSRARMVTSQAGAITVPVEADSLTIPKLLSPPTPYWRGELEEITESDPTFGAITLKPKVCAILTQVSIELSEDAVGIGQAVESALTQALAVEMDRVGLMGGDTGNKNEPVGVYYTDDVSTVEMGTDGAVPTNYDEYLDAIQEAEDANGTPSVVIQNPRTKRDLAGLKTGITDDQTPLEPPQDYKDLRRLVTTSIPNTLEWGSSGEVASAAFVGGFNNVYMGLRNRVRIDTSPAAVDSFEKMSIRIRAFVRVDFAVVRPKELVRITGILTD